MKRHVRVALAGLVFWGGTVHAAAEQPSTEKPTHQDLVYATVAETPLKLDLFLPPASDDEPPLVVFIHGGSWRSGAKELGWQFAWLNRLGYALATVQYRFTDRCAFPCQLHDVKAAIRWLRNHADTYGYDAERIVVFGASAGGHLALLAGLTGDDPELEGAVGATEGSSKVVAVINIFGPTDFMTVLDDLERIGATRDDDNAALRALLGGPLPKETPARAKQASPVTHIDAADPPVLTIHGEADRIVPVAQAQQLHRALRAAKVHSELHIVPNVGHSSEIWRSRREQAVIVRFLRNVLRADEVPERERRRPPRRSERDAD
jgi:acetyl esterase/lipase